MATKMADNKSASICIYAPFAAGWEKTTGIPTSRCIEIAEVFLSGCKAHIPDACIKVVHCAEEIPEGSSVILGCGLGNETSETFAKAGRCSVPPLWFDWINAKLTYLSDLANADVPIIPSWQVTKNSSGDCFFQDLARRGALLSSQTLAVKVCNSLGGSLAVQVLPKDEAMAAIADVVAAGKTVFVQPDLRSVFAQRGEHKVCVHVPSGRILGCRHVCPSPGREFGRFLHVDSLSVELKGIVESACDVVRKHAGRGPRPLELPLLLRVDCIEIQEGEWAINEFEPADFACWMWGSACEGGNPATNTAIFSAVFEWCMELQASPVNAGIASNDEIMNTDSKFNN